MSGELERRTEALPDRVSVDTREDTSWVDAFGGVVERDSPPVGSFAVGIPGIGFDLVSGDGTILESYGPDGRPLGAGAIAGVSSPPDALQAAGEAPEGQNRYSETPCSDGQHEWQAYDEDDCWVRTCINCPVVERDQKPAGSN